MFKHVTFSDFCDAFIDYDREDQFSYDAKKALFDYFEELEADIGSPIELDVVALCCDYIEATVDQIINDYGLDDSDCETDDDRRELVEEFLNTNTTVVWSDGHRFLFQIF